MLTGPAVTLIVFVALMVACVLVIVTGLAYRYRVVAVILVIVATALICLLPTMLTKGA